MAAPRPQEMERMLGDAQSGHALWLETTPLQTLTNPSKCQCTSGKDLLLSPLPTAAELAAALVPADEKAALTLELERSLVRPLGDMEADFEALVGPKRQSLDSTGPLWCCGTALSCAVPPLCGMHLQDRSAQPPRRSNAERWRPDPHAPHALSLTNGLVCIGRVRRSHLLPLVHYAQV